jgi:NAD dependent epimerase/dehydratase family
MFNPTTGRRVQQRRQVLTSTRRGAPSPTPLRPACGFVSKQSLLVLSVGILFGYILLPVLLVEMDIDAIMQTLPTIDRPGSISVPTSPVDGGSPYSPYLRPIAGDSVPLPQRTLDTAGTGGSSDFSAVEKRIVEDRDVLSRQSLPTATTPYVMKTQTLPDHQRLKILVTGGAGFVGSHLVDKLMMEGHEVIVVDNFFTGQKKNVAHWLHHPNFRYVPVTKMLRRGAIPTAPPGVDSGAV